MVKLRLLLADTTTMAHVNVAQLAVWSCSGLVAENIQSWYWTGNTIINSVAIGDVNGDALKETVTGGSFQDGTRLNGQLSVWGMS